MAYRLLPGSLLPKCPSLHSKSHICQWGDRGSRSSRWPLRMGSTPLPQQQTQQQKQPQHKKKTPNKFDKFQCECLYSKKTHSIRTPYKHLKFISLSKKKNLQLPRDICLSLHKFHIMRALCITIACTILGAGTILAAILGGCRFTSIGSHLHEVNSPIEATGHVVHIHCQGEFTLEIAEIPWWFKWDVFSCFWGPWHRRKTFRTEAKPPGLS